MTKIADSTSNVKMPVAQSGNVSTPSLFRLISTYWDQYDILSSVMEETDKTVRGTHQREDADQRQDAAQERVSQAALAICAYVPTWSWEARCKSHFLNCLVDGNGGNLSEEETEELLSIMPLLFVAKKGGAA